jgi:hypothetical protein
MTSGTSTLALRAPSHHLPRSIATTLGPLQTHGRTYVAWCVVVCRGVSLLNRISVQGLRRRRTLHAPKCSYRPVRNRTAAETIRPQAASIVWLPGGGGGTNVVERVKLQRNGSQTYAVRISHTRRGTFACFLAGGGSPNFSVQNTEFRH